MALTEEQLAALPPGTTNAQALAKNAADLDHLLNGDGLVENRVGDLLLSLKEAARRFGYETPVAFSAGIVVSRATQTVVHSGSTYSPDPSLLPFTTTSTFTASQWLLVAAVTPTDGSVTLEKLDAAVQNLINGALQSDGSMAMTDELELSGYAVSSLGAVPKQQAESIASDAVANRMAYTLTASQATTSGLAFDFPSIPSSAKRLTLTLKGVSFNATAVPFVQVGAGSIASSGYDSACSTITGAVGFSTATALSGFTFNTQAAGDAISGSLILTKLKDHTWVAQMAGKAAATTTFFGGGDVVLIGAIDRLRLTSVAGTASFDGGEASLLIEG